MATFMERVLGHKETSTYEIKSINLTKSAPSWSWAATEEVTRQLFPDPTPDVAKRYQLRIETLAPITFPLNPGNEFRRKMDGQLRIASFGLLTVQRPNLDSHINSIIINFQHQTRPQLWIRKQGKLYECTRIGLAIGTIQLPISFLSPNLGRQSLFCCPRQACSIWWLGPHTL